MARKYGNTKSKQAKQDAIDTGNTALYIRVSTQLQADEGYSLDGQRTNLEAYCKAQGWTVADAYVYIDAGVSGKTTDRPQLPAMLQAAQAGQIQRIVAMKLDRIARNTGDFLTIVKQLEKCGCALALVKENFETSTPQGKFAITLFAAIAEMEASMITERVMSGKAQKVTEGGYNGGRCPLGYTYSAGRFTENERASLVQSIFAMWNSGHSLNAIMRHLATTKQATSTGKGAWSVKAVKHILANGAYAGLAQWGEDNEYPSQHTPTGKDGETAPVYPTIIARPTYDAAQARLEVLTRGKRLDRAA
jgi:site-specific DNA recombinase